MFILQGKNTKYPTGEIQVNIFARRGNEVNLALLEATSDAIMTLLLEADAIRQRGGILDNLFIQFLPYARQDRVCEVGQAFSLKMLAKLINDLNFRKVLILEPHSPVATALINNSVALSFTSYLVNVARKRVVVAPDAGAEKRASLVATEFGCKFVQALKHRDKTGAIVSTQVLCDDLNGEECLIVDDICDGGRTFIELAKVLKQKNAGKIILAVAHGIFSYGTEVFKGLIDEVYYLKPEITDNGILINQLQQKVISHE